MTKRMIVKWLEEKKNEALDHERKMYEKAKTELRADLDERLEIECLIDALTPEIERINSIIDVFKNRCENTEGAKYCYWHGTLEHKFSGLQNRFDVARLVRKSYEPDYKTSETIHNSVTREIVTQYNNVIENVKGLKDAKAGIEYLKEVGFDVTTLIEMDGSSSTALMAPIDKRYLFLKGEQ